MTDATVGEAPSEQGRWDHRKPDDYFAWIEYGISKGWIERPDCIHHGDKDPIPWTQEEAEWSDDPCIVAARVWGPEGRPPQSAFDG